jgi:DNA-binding response OmpR family regulator
MDSVLVVEDSRALQKALLRLFESDSMSVRVAGGGLEAVDLFRNEPPSAVVLDLKLPGKSGKELCREFKSIAADVPIIILSANADVEDKVLLLELGADDYVTKPFSPKELLARVRRAMRRGTETHQQSAPALQQQEVFTFGEVRVNFTAMETTKGGRTVSMTAQEYKVLKFFSRFPGRVISREELLNEVWGYHNYPSTRTVDNQILRLRQKLEADATEPKYFLTVHGAGYKFVPGGRTEVAEGRA